MSVTQTNQPERPSSPPFKSPGRIRLLSNRLSLKSRRARNLEEGLTGLTLDELHLLSQADAKAVDRDLYEEYHFSSFQLAELAGLAAATAVARRNPPAAQPGHATVLVVCGPGNNGRDGLVCARHLKQFGFTPTIFCPQPASSVLMKTLVTQIEANEIATLSFLPDPALISHSYALVIDAIFGIRFVPPAREPFASALERLKKVTIPIISIDIPSGWDVNSGPLDENDCLRPEGLISLTAPKKCALSFKGKYHFIGGRFLPQTLAQKYKINLPIFPGTEQILELSIPAGESVEDPQ